LRPANRKNNTGIHQLPRCASLCRHPSSYAASACPRRPASDSVAAHAPDAGDGAGGRSQGQGLEVFKRLPPLRDVIRCAAVCRHLVAGVQTASLPVAPFMPVTVVVLGAGPFPSAAPACGVVLADFRRPAPPAMGAQPPLQPRAPAPRQPA